MALVSARWPARVLLALTVLLVLGHAAHARHATAAPSAPGHAVAARAGHGGLRVPVDAAPALARAVAITAADVAACAAEANLPARTSLLVLLGAMAVAAASRPVALGVRPRPPAAACRSGRQFRALLQVFRL